MENKNNPNEQNLIQKGEIFLNRYKIIKQIDKGGMNSDIYLAEDIDWKNNLDIEKHKYFTIKVIKRSKSLDIESWKKICDECVSLLRCTQIENIVKTYQVKEINQNGNNYIVIVMEYIQGETLRSIINRQGTLGIEQTLFLFKKILIAVRGLHNFRQKIIHRDLKPENIIISRDLTSLKIIDFGISTVLLTARDNNSKENKILTSENELYGTFPYISPLLYKAWESKKSNDKILALNEKCDFFSLGIILYEMLIGNKPFLADDYSDQSVLLLPLTYDLPAITKFNPKIPTLLENIIFRCIACKDEDIKFQYNHVDEIINDINKVINDPIGSNAKHLLKPYNKRTMQNTTFNLTKEKEKLKIYNHPWFFWLFFLIGIILIFASFITIHISTK